MSPIPAEYFRIYGRKIAESDRAILFDYCPAGNNFDACFNQNAVEREWFPLSQIASIYNTFSQESQTLDSIFITRWLAAKRGILT
jgi:hypothetical protein